MNELELAKITDLTERENITKSLNVLDMIETQIAIAEFGIKDLRNKFKEKKETLLQAMIKYDVKTFDTLNFKFTRVDATTRTILDSTKIKNEEPEIYEKYKKVSQVKPSLRITKKKEDIE